MFNREQTLHFTWIIFFLALPFSKWLSTVCELALLIFTLYKFDYKLFIQNCSRYRHIAFLAVLLLFLLFGLLYTENISHGFRVIRHQHRFLVIPFLFLANAALLQKNINQYLLAFILAAAASGLVVAILFWLPEPTTQYLAENIGIMREYPELIKRTIFGLYSPFIERIQLSSLIAVAIISAIYLVSINYRKGLCLILLAPLFYVMLILGGRGGQVSLMAALLLYAVFIAVQYIYPKLTKKVSPVAAVFILSGTFFLLFIILPWAIFQVTPSLQDRFYQTRWELELIENGNYINFDYKHFTTLNRIVSWKNMWQLVVQNPIFGTGTGDYHQELEKIYASQPLALVPFSHNQYLMLWAMTGIFTLLAFLLILSYWLFSFLGQKLLLNYAAAFLVFYIFNMIFDTVLFTQIDSMAFCSFFSLIGLQTARKRIQQHA